VIQFDDELVPPELPMAFGDDGQPVRVVEPAVWDESPADDSARAEIREALLGFLRDMIEDSTPLQAGQCMFLLVHLCGQSGCRTDAELAKRMGVSATRVSHLLRLLPPEYTGLLRCYRRQRKRRSAMLQH
jgi:hypothetical protein